VVSIYQGRSNRVDVVRGRLGPFRAARACEDVFFHCGQFGVLDYHSEVVTVKVVIADVPEDLRAFHRSCSR
jgi:hypothetical protein